MSSQVCSVKSERIQFFLQPRPESSKENKFIINKGYGVEVRGVKIQRYPRSVKIECTGAGISAQSSIFTVSRNHVFELLIAKDVQKIPVTLCCSSRAKTIVWQAPFAPFPIDVEVERTGGCFVVLPEERNEAADSKESKKNDEAVSSAVGTGANESDPSKKSMQCTSESSTN